MKICVDAREFVAHRKTGISRYLENLLAPLLCEPQLEIVLFVHDPDFVPQALRSSSVKCVKVPSSPTLLVDQIVLPWLTEKEKADVFFSPYYKVPLFGKFKRIITVHDIMFLRLPRHTNAERGMRPGFAEGALAAAGRIADYLTLRCLKKFLVKQQLRMSTSKADIILVDSDFTQTDLTDFLPSVRDKTRTLYPSLGPEWFRPVNSETLKEARQKFANNRSFFLYVGNFKPHKNVDLLVRAFLDLQAEGKTENRCLLLAGGDPKNLPRIEVLVRSAGKEGLIRICRDVDDITLKALYSTAEWFITASEYEGFGYPILEAMASGCPVICHPCTAIPEVAGDSALEIARLDPENIAKALHSALSTERSERDTLIEKGRNRARKFLTGNSSQLFLEVLKALCIGVA